MSKAERTAIIAIPIVLVIMVGLAWAGGQDGASVENIPLFAICVGVAFIVQWIAFIPAFIMQTERFYDITGSITYISVILLAVWLSPENGLRDWLLLALVMIWAIRLGSFLFIRIHATGADTRFDEIKPSIPRFLLAWTLQGAWVSFSLAAALAAITAQTKPEIGIFELIGFVVWSVGFGIEVISDQQKNQFRKNPDNKGKFIQTGLWAWSRHPNYFGEIVLWVGIAIIAFPVLSGWQYVTLISPVFVTLLLTRVSGVPMLEARADEKWGGQDDYEAYKTKTPVLLMRPPAKS